MNKKNNNNLSTFSFILIMIMSCLVSFFLFIILLHTPLFSNMQVYMYRGIILLIISAIFNIILLILMKNMILPNLNTKDIICITIVFLSASMMFFTLVPVTVERSVSVHMLFSIEENNGMTKQDIQDNFINNYVIENDAFQKRIIEQEATGSIKIDKVSNKYKLTKRGQFITSLFRLIGKLFNANMSLMK